MQVGVWGRVCWPLFQELWWETKDHGGSTKARRKRPISKLSSHPAFTVFSCPSSKEHSKEHSKEPSMGNAYTRREMVRCSNADADGPVGGLSSHLLSDPLNLWICVFFTWTHLRSSWIKSKQAAILVIFPPHVWSGCVSTYCKVQGALSATLVPREKPASRGKWSVKTK